MNELLMEQELKVRIFQHMTTVLAAQYANQYIQSQTTGMIQLPLFQVREQAVEVANNLVQKVIANGQLEEEYLKAWDEIKDKIPDNYSTLL